MRPRPGTAALLLSAAACGVASPLAKAPEFAPKDQTKCQVSKSQAHPLVVEWPSADRQELETRLRHGVVAVHYVGCEMEVLERCDVSGAKYGYLGSTRKEDRVDINDEDDLYANLPVGAAKLEAKLQRSGSLTVEMNLVGRYESERPAVRADELSGECTGATHFVYGATVGAFDFYAAGEGTASGGVGAAGAGAGGESRSSRKSISRDGDASACAKATSVDKLPPENCGALIRIEVVPLDGVRAAAAAGTSCTGATHFEAGRGCVADPAPAPPAPASPPRLPAPPPAVPEAARAAMLGIPAGTFTLPYYVPKGETPRRARVSAFELDPTEVTVAAYVACVRAGSCTPAAADKGCDVAQPGKANHPINCVDWNQATAYCAWAGKRLPTEDEWNLAAWGTEGRKYVWGSDSPAPGFFCGSSGTCPVASHPKDRSLFGVYDMAGNVQEWTSSRDGADGSARVILGGAWREPDSAEAGTRSTARPEFNYDWVGFRCAR